MDNKTSILNRFKKIFKTRSRIFIFLIIVLVLGIGIWRFSGSKEQKPQYQTSQAEKGTLIISVSATGQISAANSASVTTQTSGVVKNIFVENGQKVNSGDPIAEVDLDMDGKQRANQALASYQGAKNSLDSANANLYTSQSTMFSNWIDFMDTAQNSTYQNPDGSPKEEMRNLPQFMITNNDWMAAEAKYKIQKNAILQAQTTLSSSWASYQQASPIIYAPISGTITGLSLQIGSVLTAQTGSSGNSASQRIANIKTEAAPLITVNLTEVDVPKVKIGNKATVTLDALSGKTFTGKIVSIDTTGEINSGVTTYLAIIKLDTESEEIFPNMSTQANIITQVKNDVLLVPTSAVQTQNEQSFVQVIKNGKLENIDVETGTSSDTQIEIVSGLSEGDIVATSTISTASETNQRGGQSQSPFSSFGGGGAVRIPH